MKRRKFFASIVGLFVAVCSGLGFTKPSSEWISPGFLSLIEQIHNMSDEFLLDYYLICKKDVRSNKEENDAVVFLCHHSQKELELRNLMVDGRLPEAGVYDNSFWATRFGLAPEKS